MQRENKIYLYLDDVRTPTDDRWQVVRNHEEFVAHIRMRGLENYEVISLDHDLGDTAMAEYYNNVSKNYVLDYNNIDEKTGYDAAKWLVNEFYSVNEDRINMTSEQKRKSDFVFPTVYVHSANPVGAHNICGYINNFFKNEKQKETCVRVNIPIK